MSPRWLGKCPECGTWESYVEEVEVSSAIPKGRAATRIASASTAEVITLSEVSAAREPRITTAIAELDRVLGGGIMPGSIVLVGGDPGVGKSTLMAQMCMGLDSRPLLYVTG